jgi:hypothetical protein
VFWVDGCAGTSFGWFDAAGCAAASCDESFAGVAVSSFEQPQSMAIQLNAINVVRNMISSFVD